MIVCQMNAISIRLMVAHVRSDFLQFYKRLVAMNVPLQQSELMSIILGLYRKLFYIPHKGTFIANLGNQDRNLDVDVFQSESLGFAQGVWRK